MSAKKIVVLVFIVVICILIKVIASDEKKMAKAILLAVFGTVEAILITPVGNQFADAFTNWLFDSSPQGDVNGDNKITQQDVDIALEIATSHVAKESVYISDDLADAADFNRDGKIDVRDVHLIQVYCYEHGSEG